jgi:hypothetical protein
MSELDSAVEKGIARLEKSRTGDLPLAAREAVWTALGPRGGESGRPGPGWERRAQLAIATCEHVLPLWEGDRPGDHEPRDVLGLARAALHDAGAADHARAQAGRLWARTDNITQLAGDPARAMVGYACAKAVNVALYDEEFGSDDGDDDRGRDAARVDTAFMAAAASSGGLPEQTFTDTEARREFWRWWLGTARALGAPSPAP